MSHPFAVIAFDPSEILEFRVPNYSGSGDGGDRYGYSLLHKDSNHMEMGSDNCVWFFKTAQAADYFAETQAAKYYPKSLISMASNKVYRCVPGPVVASQYTPKGLLPV